jgi:hypothetical protein
VITGFGIITSSTNEMKALATIVSILLICGCFKHGQDDQGHSIVGLWKGEVTSESAAFFGKTAKDFAAVYLELEFHPDGSLDFRGVDPVAYGTYAPQFMSGHYSISNTVLRFSVLPGREEQQTCRIEGDRMYLAPREFGGHVTNLLVRIKNSRFK